MVNVLKDEFEMVQEKGRKTSYEARNSAKINLHKYTVTENYDT